ncbi:MAG: GC-type dockerin domain-anchored protein [Phycisphaerales bacterium]|jgi:hypothetical protein|nr:GC-type dockerin domain-anchored protein [Phycisphaerales bacterium]
MFRWKSQRRIDHTPILVMLASAVLTPLSLAQGCEPRVHRTFSPPLAGPVWAMSAWDPDGPGPQGERVAFGGTFEPHNGGDFAPRFAIYDLGSKGFFPVPETPDAGVYALASDADRGMYVGGVFTTIADESFAHVARWDGDQWHTLGDGITQGDYVIAILVLPNRDVIVAGNFSEASGVPASNIARWDGSSWHPLGDGLDGSVTSLALAPDGSVIAGGEFIHAGELEVNRVARWDGTQWAGIGGGFPGNPNVNDVQAVAALPDGSIVAGGVLFGQAGMTDNQYVRRWNGAQWEGLDVPDFGVVHAMAIDGNGHLVVGRQTNSTGSTQCTWRWDGVAWQPIGGNSRGDVRAMSVLSDGTICVGGANFFAGFGSLPGGAFVYMNEDEPPSLFGSGAVSEVRSILTRLSGDFYVACALSIYTRGIAWWAGDGWLPLRDDWSSSSTDASKIIERSNGDLIVTGFDGRRVQLFDGDQWTSIGTGINDDVLTALETHAGELLIAGSFTQLPGGVPATGLARWDGTQWHAFGDPLTNTAAVATIRALAELPNGDIIAAGDFDASGSTTLNNIARWNGTSWQPLAGGIIGEVNALLVLPNGDLVAGGWFIAVDGVSFGITARWDGTRWSPYGRELTQRVRVLATLNDGTPIAAGDNVLPDASVAKFNGAAWEPLVPQTDGRVYDVAQLAGGDVVLVGDFEHVLDFDGQSWIPSQGVARVSLACCLADWDSSGGAPNSSDFLAYLNDWSAHAPAADLAPAGGDGNWDSSDFLAFLNLFANGC